MAFLFSFLMGAVPSAQAAFCTDYPNSTLDGDTGLVLPSTVTIDDNCTFKNWPASNPLTSTLNFQTNDPSIYLIIFDNVYFDGNMACANIDHRLWPVNGFIANFSSKCQDLFIPVESIDKQVPAGQTTAVVGEPFTYTLTFPSMLVPAGDPSPNELRKVIISDDLTATGADLTYVSINAYYKGSGTPVTLVPEDGSSPDQLCGVWSSKNLCYKPIPLIAAGEQIVVEITVVADDTPANVAGTVFTNTAKWWFEREIDVDGDGIITP
ncbi:MAG: hypothetical protein OEZ23_03700, partial [Gammaproteobacteria bacterium]|nr:hypothetical protein [Gammaproteobacteria bacterium]